jgi:hypothetical protein
MTTKKVLSQRQKVELAKVTLEKISNLKWQLEHDWHDKERRILEELHEGEEYKKLERDLEEASKLPNRLRDKMHNMDNQALKEAELATRDRLYELKMELTKYSEDVHIKVWFGATSESDAVKLVEEVRTKLKEVKEESHV